MWIIKIRSLKRFSRKVAELSRFKSSLVSSCHKRNGSEQLLAENLSERDLVTSYLASFPAIEERELQTSEQQIWCQFVTVPRLIAVILPNLEWAFSPFLSKMRSVVKNGWDDEKERFYANCGIKTLFRLFSLLNASSTENLALRATLRIFTTGDTLSTSWNCHIVSANAPTYHIKQRKQGKY